MSAQHSDELLGGAWWWDDDDDRPSDHEPIHEAAPSRPRNLDGARSLAVRPSMALFRAGARA